MMSAAAPSSAPLYQTILGEDWNRLSPALRHAHRAGQEIVSRGRFDCIHAPGLLARLFIRLMRLPPAGREIPTTLQISREADHERWRRHFAGFPLESRQYRLRQGVLAERFGVIQFSFLLKLQNAGICYVECGKALCLGRLCLPIPEWFGPNVAATEMPGEEVRRTLISVRIRLPLVGPLVEYRGWMDAAD
jgi:hypothetical protein